MFSGCNNLTSLDISSFDTSNTIYFQYMFQDCKSLISLDLLNFITTKVDNMESMFNGCNNLITLNLSNFITDKVIYMKYMFYDCFRLKILDLSNFNILSIQNMDNFFSYTNTIKYINMKNSVFPNDLLFIKIFENIQNDVLICKKDLNETIIYLNRIKIYNYCGDDWELFLSNITEQNKSNYSLSYDSNSISYLNNYYLSTDLINNNIPDTYNKVEELKTTTINLITNAYISKGFSTYKEYIGDLTLEKLIFGNDMELLLIDIDNKTLEKKIDNKKYYISTLSNQEKQNCSFIDLGNCTNLLKEENGIKENEELVIFKIENKIEGIKIPIIEYEIYSKNGTKLRLDICKNELVTYFMPVTIDVNELFKYDPESSFYNDKCDKYTTDNKTDMTLYDRRNEFNNNNLSLCEKMCNYKGYNKSTSKVECYCILKQKFNEKDIIEDEPILKLSTSKSNINMDIMQCTEYLNSIGDLISNPGFYLLIFILVLFFIVFIIFFFKGYNSLKNNIDEVIDKRFKLNDNNNIIKNKKIINSTKHNKEIKKKKKKKNKKVKNQESTTKYLYTNKKASNNTNIKRFSPKKTDENKNELKATPLESDYELNNGLYEDAKRFDKRSSCEYYLSLLKNKQIFIFSFITFDDYNSGIIKKCIFFLSFALHYTINALFFNDSNMNQIFKDQGDYNINYQIPFIIISALSSTIILRIMLTTLILTDKNIFEIKCQVNIIKANILKKKTLKFMKVKFSIFFGLNMILLVLFWYYLTCWNAVYENTQLYLIKNSLISFAISLIYPFIINIIPTILRNQSLQKNKRECLYNTSKILQIL
jgi:surface protein